MTGQVVVAGVVNVQQTVPVDGFPVPYTAVRYPTRRLRLEASGVGLNVARTLRALGTEVSLAALVGTDPAGVLVRDELDRAGLLGDGVRAATETPLSAVMVDPHGARQINTDLKDVPDATYPPAVFRELLDGAQLAVLTTIGFARSLVPLARAAGVPVAVDLQTINSVGDAYHQPWMRAADVMFCSAERLDSSPIRFVQAALDRFPAQIVVVGQGAEGCLVAVRGQRPRHLLAVAPHGVVDTTGAGDALFAGFLHYWLKTRDAAIAAARAVVVAGCAVGTAGSGVHVDETHVASLLPADHYTRVRPDS